MLNNYACWEILLGEHRLNIVHNDNGIYCESLDEYYDDNKDYTAPYIEKIKQRRKAEWETIKEDIRELRKYAKALGGKALAGGSPKQRLWAEQIRAKVLERATLEEAIRLVTENRFSGYRFWIDNRSALLEGTIRKIF